MSEFEGGEWGLRMLLSVSLIEFWNKELILLLILGEITSLGVVWLYCETIGERDASRICVRDKLGDGGQRDGGCEVPMFRYLGNVGTDR